MKQVKTVYRGSPIAFSSLIEKLTGLSARETALLVEMGGAYLGKNRCKDPGHMVKPGMTVEAWYRLPLVMEPIPFDPDWILAGRDGYLIASKPAGIPTQGRRDADYMAFYELLKKALPGYLGLHHRLDQDTSGLMLFTRDRDCNKDAARGFQDRLIHKTYLAVVSGTWPFSGDQETIDAPIGTERGPRGSRHRVMKSGKPALTEITRLAQDGELILVQARPRTGRTHQIRVHLSHFGLPLWNDRFYGSSSTNQRFLLHCARLSWQGLGSLKSGDYRAAVPQIWYDTLPDALTNHLLD